MKEVNRYNIDNKYIVTMYLLSPFLLLLFSFRSIKSKWAKNALWAFIVFFGFTMIIKTEGLDSFHYLKDLQYMHSHNFTFKDLIASFYVTNAGIDIFQPFLTFLVSLFTDSQNFLFAVFAFVFGYFYTRSIWILINHIEYRIDWFQKLLILSFALIVPFWNINGFRFWVAAIIYFYGIIHFFLNKENKYLLFIVMTPFMHFAFFGPMILFFVYKILGNRTLIYFSLFITSIFMSEIELSAFNDIFTTYLPELFVERTTGYVDENYAEAVREHGLNANWYVDFMQKGILWFLRISIITIYLVRLYLNNSIKKYDTLISFAFLFGVFANILSTIPSGLRFILIFNLFAMAYVILNYYNFKFRRVFYVGIPLIFIFCIVSIRMGFSFINIVAIFGNPFISLIDDNTIALIDLIK